MAMITITRSARAQAYDHLGYHIEPGLFKNDVQRIADTFMEMHAKGGVKGFYEPHPEGSRDGFHFDFKEGDPLAVYPRVMHPHRFMPIMKHHLLDGQIFDVLEDLLGEEALAAQSMFYFKPPGARGQAWHQDNFYLNVRPGTCIAAWVAVDPMDEGNGGLQVIPNTHEIPLICPDRNADSSVSFTKEIIPMKELVKTMGVTYDKDLEVPSEGVTVHKLQLEAGDVLFFNGNVVHGSRPNMSKDRFRRSFICHYVGVSCLEVAHHYHPLFNRHGQEVSLKVATGGGPCGTEHQETH